MKKILYFVFAFALLLLSVAVSSYADGRRHHHGYHHGHGRVIISGGVYLGPGWWDPWPGPYYSHRYYPYYAQPPIVIQQQPVYEEQAAPEQYYWYFCPDSKTYYPYVKQCPGGWLKVVPKPEAPQGP